MQNLDRNQNRTRLAAIVALLLLVAFAGWGSVHWARVSPDDGVDPGRASGRSSDYQSQPATNTGACSNAPYEQQTPSPPIKGERSNACVPSADPIPEGPREIPVDINISVAKVPEASAYVVLSSNPIISGCSSKGSLRSVKTSKAVNLMSCLRNGLQVQIAKYDTIAIALFLLLQPLDAEGTAIPGTVVCFAADKIINGDELAHCRRIVLEQSVPGRDVTLLFRPEDSEATCQLPLIHINESAWLATPEAQAVEPGFWPSESSKQFRQGKEGAEFTPLGRLFANVTVGRDAKLRMFDLPIGFGFPLALNIGQNRPDALLETRFNSASAGKLVESRQKNRRALLPRDGETLVYAGTPSDYLPQIELSGSLAPSEADWVKYRVFCRRPAWDSPHEPGVDIAQARYQKAERRWVWYINSRLDLTKEAGARVFYTLQEVRTGFQVVEGTLSPSPSILIQVEKPLKPWTIAITAHDGDSLGLAWPISVSYSFGGVSGSFKQDGWTSEFGSLGIADIEGPPTETHLNRYSGISVAVQIELLKALLTDLYQAKTHDTRKIELTINPDHPNSGVTRADFAARTIEFRWGFKVFAACGDELQCSLREFLEKNGLVQEYADALGAAKLKQ